MIGLLYTPVSIYQMTRGALVLWVGLFSVMFLRRKLWLYQYVCCLFNGDHKVLNKLDYIHSCRWLSLVTVMIGVSIVGLSGSLAKDAGKGDASLQSLVARIAQGEEPPSEATVFIGILFILFAQLL